MVNAEMWIVKSNLAKLHKVCPLSALIKPNINLKTVCKCIVNTDAHMDIMTLPEFCFVAVNDFLLFFFC